MEISASALGIIIGIANGITNILFLPYVICLKKNGILMSNTPQYLLLCTVVFTNLLVLSNTLAAINHIIVKFRCKKMSLRTSKKVSKHPPRTTVTQTSFPYEISHRTITLLTFAPPFHRVTPEYFLLDNCSL